MTVKVADFGLSRDVYVTEYYTMSQSIPLPVKWLAPEALFDRHFNEKTDVVSDKYFISLIYITYSTYLHWLTYSYLLVCML